MISLDAISNPSLKTNLKKSFWAFFEKNKVGLISSLFEIFSTVLLNLNKISVSSALAKFSYNHLEAHPKVSSDP